MSDCTALHLLAAVKFFHDSLGARPVPAWALDCDCLLDPHHRWDCSLTPIWAQTMRDLDCNPVDGGSAAGLGNQHQTSAVRVGWRTRHALRPGSMLPRPEPRRKVPNVSLPYHKVDWELVAEVRRTQGRVTELEKQVRELHRLVSANAPPPDADPITFADTCCGKCQFGTCYVDQMTGA